MQLTCPMCNVPMAAPDNAAGTTVKCTTCGHGFVAGGGAPQGAPQVGRRPCPLCGQPVAAGAVKCPHCRGTIGTVPCTACAEQIPADASVCPFCNTPARARVQAGPAAVYTAPGQNPPASKVLCGILAIVLPFGIHRFLMGYTGLGIAQIIVFIVTCGISSIWAWIEAIMIFTGSLKMADGRPLQD